MDLHIPGARLDATTSRVDCGLLIRRRAALPADMLTGILPAPVETALAPLRAGFQRLAKTGPALTDRLHALVPLASDAALRRGLLDFKRAAHAGRPYVPGTPVLDFIAAQGPDAAVDDYAATSTAILQAQEMVADLAATGDHDLIDRVLDKALGVNAFAAALALAAPAVCRRALELRRQGRLSAGLGTGKVARQLRQTLLNYAVRAASKTSAFSSFALLSLPDDGIADTGVRRAVVPDVRLDAPLAPGGLVRPVSPLASDGTMEFPVQREEAGGQGWMAERIIRLRIPPPVAAILWQLPDGTPAAGIADALAQAGLPHDKTAGLLREFERLGVIRPAAPMTGHTDWTARAAAFASMPAADRADLLCNPGDGQPRNPFYEYAWESSGNTTTLAPDRLAALAAVAEKRARIDDGYAHLLRSFLSRHGVGGMCDNLLRVICDAHADIATHGPAWRLGGEVEIAGTLGVTLHVQPIRQFSPEAPWGALNAIYERAGWQAARYVAGDGPDARALARRLSDWLGRLSGPAEPVEITLGSGRSNLQWHDRILPRALAWPNEPIPAGTDAIDPRRVSVWHDPASNRLRLADGEGREIAPLYLGAAVPHPGWGPRFLATLLSTPFSLRRPMRQLGAPEAAAGDIVAAPSIMEGGLVLLREGWWLRTTALPDLRDRQQRHAILHKYLVQAGVARHVFATAISHAGTPQASLPSKPVWLDLDLPSHGGLLADMAATADWLLLRRAVPGPGEHHLCLDGKDYSSDLHVELALPTLRRSVLL